MIYVLHFLFKRIPLFNVNINIYLFNLIISYIYTICSRLLHKLPRYYRFVINKHLTHRFGTRRDCFNYLSSSGEHNIIFSR